MVVVVVMVVVISQEALRNEGNAVDVELTEDRTARSAFCTRQ